jgi:hypothetical protein
MDRAQLLELALLEGNGFNASYSSYLIQDRRVIIWPLFPLLSSSENRCVNGMKPLVKQIWRHCEFLSWKRRCIDTMVVCNEMLPISTMFLVYRKYFFMLNTVMKINFETSFGKYILLTIYTTVLEITGYTFGGGGILHKKKPVSSCLSVCPHVSTFLPTDGVSWNFLLTIVINSAKRNQILLQSDNIGCFTWSPQYFCCFRRH